jgi:hypothetical protein
MLFLKLQGYYPYLKPFLLLMGYMPEVVYNIGDDNRNVYSTDITMDEYIIKVLRGI